MNKAYVYAVSLLAKREYGASELITKLKHKGFSSDIIDSSVAKLRELGLQSDERYAEMIARARIRQGYGPQRIKQELMHTSIASDLIEDIIAVEKDNWVAYALKVWHKKYNWQLEYSSQDIQKQKSFLYSRGFTMDTIAVVFKEGLPIGDRSIFEY